MISYTLKVTLTFGVFLINRPNKLILGIRGEFITNDDDNLRPSSVNCVVINAAYHRCQLVFLRRLHVCECT